MRSEREPMTKSFCRQLCSGGVIIAGSVNTIVFGASLEAEHHGSLLKSLGTGLLNGNAEAFASTDASAFR